MQTFRANHLKIVTATVFTAFAVRYVPLPTVAEGAIHACAATIDFAANMAELPCRLARDIKLLPERMDPTCSECNEP